MESWMLRQTLTNSRMRVWSGNESLCLGAFVCCASRVYVHLGVIVGTLVVALKGNYCLLSFFSFLLLL
ncbi:hypothetical protein F4810DRAFT_677315 [Camillea tinctor]|nr:hypothetical protein F4810DRAFT_677315 [Camillea tinctor]